MVDEQTSAIPFEKANRGYARYSIRSLPLERYRAISEQGRQLCRGIVDWESAVEGYGEYRTDKEEEVENY